MKITCLRFLLMGFMACLLSMSTYGQAVGHIENEDPEGPFPHQCYSQIVAKVWVANLELLVQPDGNGIYHLPSNYPDIYAHGILNTNNAVGTGLIKDFEYSTTLNGINYYVGVVELNVISTSSFCDPVPTGTLVIMPYTLKLQTELGAPYPICNFTAPYDIFSCAAFDATEDYCYDQGTGLGSHNYNECSSAELASVAGNTVFECKDCGMDFNSDEGELRNADMNEKELLNDVLVTPNPFNESIQITWDAASAVEDIRLFDASGKLLEQRNFSLQSDSGNWYINTSELPSGLYFLHLKNETNAKVFKLIKQ